MSKKKPDSFSIIFQEREPKPTIAVSGAWGGPNLQGEVIAHVYVEHAAVPSLMSADVSPEGRIDLGAASTIKRADVIREIQASLVMSPEVAASFGTWLLEKATQAAQNRKQMNSE